MIQRQAHLPYEVGTSSCWGLTDFRAHDNYPMRSPMVVADFLASKLAYGASFAEVGTRDGDIITCVSKLAVRVRAVAVEQSPRRCEVLRQRGVVAVQRQVNETSYLEVLPTADVWYYWGITNTNQQMVRWIDRAMRARGRAGTVYLGFDWHYPGDRKDFSTQVLEFRKMNRTARIHRLFFDEQGASREGMETEPAIAPSGMQLPGYLKPFAKRPGAWGVFHLLGVEVGLGQRPLMINSAGATATIRPAL